VQLELHILGLKPHSLCRTACKNPANSWQSNFLLRQDFFLNC